MSDAPAWLDEAIRRKDEMGLRALATSLGVGVGELSLAFRDHGVRRRVHAVPEPDTPAPPASDASSSARPGSKDAQVETYRTLLGKVPDSEVARLADVSVRTIASYRSRHDIEGYRGPRRRTPGGPGRESRVDAYADLLGRVPDRVIAELAGMSLGAVRNYRIKVDVEPCGRIPPSEIQRRLAQWRTQRVRHEGVDPVQTAPGGLPRSVLPVASVDPAPASGQPRAWRYTTRGSTGVRVVLANTIAEALARVGEVVGGADLVESVEDVGPVLAVRD